MAYYQEGANLLGQITFSEHAQIRMAQRRLTVNDVMYVVSHGQQYRCGGVIHFFLGKRDIPQQDRRSDRFARLEGTTVLLDSISTETIVTVYRNRCALKSIRPKTKRNLRRTVDYKLERSPAPV